MIPNFPGASAQNFTSTPSGGHDRQRDRPPPSDEPPEKFSPRMVQPPPEAEKDGMEVDNPDDEQARLEERVRPPKRGRETDAEVEDVHSEPSFKRQRTGVETPPDPREAGYLADSSSSSSSSSTSGLPASAGASSVAIAPLALGDSEVADLFKHSGHIDTAKAAAALFGAAANGWPEGFSLLEIAGVSPAMEQVLTECGVRMLWKGAVSDGRPDSLALVTPESDRERLSLALLQMQLNESEPGPLAPGVAGNPDGQDLPVAVDSSEDESSEDESEEFPRPPVGKHSTALMIAAALDDDKLVRSLLDGGADPNRRDPNGRTALMIAASRGHLRIVRSLIHDRRTQTSLINTSGWDALCEAAAEGHRKVVSLLLSFGGASLPPQVSPQTGIHPLLLAAKHGHHAVCELIVSKGVDIDIEDHRQWTALWHAAHEGQLECCEHLLDAGANINHIQDSGESLLFRAVSLDEPALFDLLLKRGATLTCGQRKELLLNVAVKKGRKAMVWRLIELNVDINATGLENQTALTVACRSNSTEIAERLLKAGANPDIADTTGWNSLVYAAAHGNNKLLEMLIEHGAKLNGKADFGYLALYEATKNARLDTMHLLLSKGAAVMTLKRRPSTPLILLPMNPVPDSHDSARAIEAICLLMAFNTPLNEVDEDGRDVLMRAVAANLANLIPILFKAGMTVGQTDRFGLDALRLAVQKCEEVMAGTPGPVSPLLTSAVRSLWTIVESAKRQPNWPSLARAAILGATHTITREIICQINVQPDPPGEPVLFVPSGLNLDGAYLHMQYVCLNAGENWDRLTTEIKLCFAGVPVPAINNYCAHIEAFPALKPRLFGPGPTSEIPSNRWAAFFYGVTANMEKMVVAGDQIENAYEDLGWELGRDILTNVARNKIWVASNLSAPQDQAQGMVFAELFDECLQAVLSAQSEQVLDLHAPPASGVIAKTLMSKGVYAALADEVEKAWRTAWSETVEAVPAEAFSSSSSSASSSALSSRPEDVAMLAAGSGTSPPVSYKQLSKQQSSALLSAFRKALAKSVDSARLLEFPGASPEVAGLYADLMHRQLHMLVQFIRPETEVEAEVEVEREPVAVATPVTPAPVMVPAPAPEPAPDPLRRTADHLPDRVYSSELWDLTVPAEWPEFDDLLPPEDLL